jgi:hypothetical protein
MKNAFRDRRSMLWLGGVIVLMVGMLLAFVLLPSTQAPSSSPTDDIRVPKMENVPSGDAPKMKLDVDDKQ